MAKGCFDDQKNDFGERSTLLRRSFITNDNNDVDTWKVKFFIRITTKYVIKYNDKLLSLRKVYCDIVIA